MWPVKRELKDFYWTKLLYLRNMITTDEDHNIFGGNPAKSLLAPGGEVLIAVSWQGNWVIAGYGFYGS